MLKILIIQVFLVLQTFGSFESISQKCRLQFLVFEEALSNQRDWALLMYDKWGKFQHGVLDGNIHNFGDYEGCINFEHKTALSVVETIYGKHCMISHTGAIGNETNFSLNFDWKELGALANTEVITLTTGICVFSACTTKDVEHLAEYVFTKSDMFVTSVSCENSHRISLRTLSIAIVIFALLLLAVICSTIYELHMHHNEETPKFIFAAFSVYTNGKILFDMRHQASTKSIECLNGLRVLSLLWIIFGHRYFEMFLAPATNPISATESWLKTIFSLAHTTFHLAVDTFFLMGGLLTTWSLMKSFDGNNFNFVKIFFHRFLRYTPVLLFLLLFFISFTPYLGSGPMFEKTIENWLPNCYSYWWSTILHIATFTNIDKLCMNWTWYLAADFQMFVLSPILVYPVWRWRWKCFSLFPALIFISMVYIFMVSKAYEFQVFVGPLQSIGQRDYDRLIYYPTFARFGPWLVGMMLGFVMYQHGDKRISVNKHFSKAMWILSLSVLLAVVIGYFPFQQAENYRKIPNVVNAIYNASFRVSWALAISWLIFGCQNGTGGIIRWFLSLPHFQPLSRMSLSVYLTHRVYQIVKVASIKQPVYLNPFDLLHDFFGDVIMSLIIGTVVYLFIEAPFTNIENRLLNKK